MKSNIRKSVGLILGVFTLFGLFAGGAHIASAQSASSTCNSATLYGTVYPNGVTTEAWFDWGTDPSMPWSTNPKQTFSASTPSASYSQTIYQLQENTTYHWQAVVRDANGVMAKGTPKQFTTPPCQQTPTTPQPTVNISANPSSVSYNGSSTINWNSTNATSCTATGGTNGWAGGKNLSGTFYTDSLTSSKNFSITCTNSAGSDSASVTVNVSAQPQTPQPTVSLTANPTSVQYGGTTHLSWTAHNATSCSLSGAGISNGSNATQGDIYTGALTTTTTFYITCSGSGSSASDSVTVTVGSQPQQQAPTVSIYANPSFVSYNGSSTITWTSSNATSCTATGGTNGWSGNKNTSGSFNTGTLTSAKTFNITCYASNGQSASDSALVNVGAQQQTPTCTDPSASNVNQPGQCVYPSRCTDPAATNVNQIGNCQYPQQTPKCQDPQASNYLQTGQCQYNQQPTPTLSLTADQSAVNSGAGTTLTYSSNLAQCTATGGTNGWAGTKSMPGTFYTGALYQSTTFTMTCNNSTGSNTKSVTVGVNNGGGNNNQVTVDIHADDTSIDEDDSTRITWTSNNASYCTATGGRNGWAGSKSTSGSFQTGDLSNDTTYTITCYASNGTSASDSDSVTVRVDDDSDNNDLDLNLDAERTSVSYGNSTIIRWDSDDADDCDATGGTNGWARSNRNTSGSFNTGPLFSDTTFRMTCENDDDDISDSVTVRVDNNNNGGGNIPLGSAPTAVTTVATNIGSGSAQLNSLIFTGNTNTNAWFEWGTTASLGNNTRSSSVGSINSAVYSDTITGLSGSARYYYRAVAENNAGKSFGSIMSFTTNSGVVLGSSTTNVVQRTVYVNGGTGVKSLVMLTIDGGSEFITPGEHRSYHVTWRNTSSQTLRKVVLRVIFPGSMTFEDATDGAFSTEDNTLILNIKNLAPGEEGDMFLSARANNPLSEQELIVVTANMVYTDQSDVQNDALAYATHRVGKFGNMLGASAFWAGIFPNTFLGWLLLLLLILLLLLLAKYLQREFAPRREIVVERHPLDNTYSTYNPHTNPHNIHPNH